MEEKRLVDKSPHWPSLVNKAILEESELLYHIAKCGNILDVANRTLEVMLDEYFDSDGIQLPVRERWVQAQTNTIESIMENLTKNVATFEAALQCRGRLLLGMCSKVMHERYKDGDIEMASNFLRAAQSQLVRAMSIATSVSNVDIMEDCAKELLLCDVTSDEFTRLSRLCIFQSCENWKYVRQLWKDINWSTDSSLVLGAVHEANQRITVGQAHSLSFKRSQPTVLSAENIVDLPKNLKVLVLKHSDDRTRLFGAIVYRTKDVAPSKAKNPMEDFYIANASLEVDEGVLQNLVNRVQSISASALKGFVPDMNLIEDIYQYLEPILRIMEIDVSKIPEKSESKKKAAVAGKPIESDEVDRGHCVVCLDSLLEPIPIEMVLRVKNLVTSASRDFGMSFLLNRIKSSPGFAGRPMSGAPGPTLTKSDKKGQPGAIAVEKWDILKINLLANHEVPKELSGPVPSNLEFDVRVGNLNLNEIGGAFESAQVVILLDKGMTLDPSALAILSTPPHIVVSLECADFAEPLEKFNSSSKALAAYNYMNGVAFTITNACPSFPEQNYAFIRQLVKTKDVIKLKSDMSSEEIQNKRVFFGAYFVKCYGFL
ncbi:hypothetical protein BC830DRAFT_1170073 [Chytriomyces sp. MP71]|nr:hypothetical protein BC830DRAFT_1170073 [Chytriomyces sp. MP71]